MSRLSDFQQQSVVVDPKKMEDNAKASATRVDWRATKIKNRVRGGRMDVQPFAEASRQIARNIAFDAEQTMRTARRIAMHIALDEALDNADEEPAEEDKDAEPPESMQRSHGGGCGKSFTCDSGQIINQNTADEFRRRGLSYGVF
jgi:hypothetical protein